jgi:hypothetical protein
MTTFWRLSFWSIGALVGGFLILLCPLALAQTTGGAEKRPTPPLINKPAIYDRWSIVITPLVPSAAPNPNPVITQMDLAKSAKAASRVTTWSNGKSNEDWIADGFFLSRQAGRTEIHLSPMKFLPPATFGNGFNNFDTVYPGFTWLDLKYYKDIVHANGKQCYHYINGKLQGWIDIETNLPVAYDDNSNHGVYQFLAPPTEELKVPDDFSHFLIIYKKAMAR